MPGGDCVSPPGHRGRSDPCLLQQQPRRLLGRKVERSDVEALLAGYLKWGDDIWLRAEGMYAAAIWDRPIVVT